VITVAYYALVNPSTFSMDTAKATWIKVDDVGDGTDLAFDHVEILRYAVKRLRAKVEYTTVAFGLLPDEFTLSQLQSVYESILNKKMDEANFRRKIRSIESITETGRTQENVSHRPAKMYRLLSSIGDPINMLCHSCQLNARRVGVDHDD